MDELEEGALLEVAKEAATAAAAELWDRFGREAHGVRSKTTPTDLVSDADVAAEEAIRSVLGRRRPGDEVVGEEGSYQGSPPAGAPSGSAAIRWIVDPLDGTVNFLFGIPVFAVSVACESAGETVAGVVLDPVREECFAATFSGPPTLNGEEFRRNPRAESLGVAMVATGFGYDSAMRARQAAVAGRLLPRVRDIRRAGAAAIDLAWTAYGRYDAYYERGLHVWDLAAGSLIATRAGLEVRHLPATAEDPWGVVVAPAALIDNLYELVVE